MSVRKLGVIKSKKKYRPEILDAYSIEQVCDMLNGYLSDEITIRSDPKRGYPNKNNKSKPSAAF